MNDDWLPVGSVADLDPEYPVACRVGDIEVALHLVEGKVYATNNLCTHVDARLSDGVIEGFEVLCPLHGGSFDVRSGAAVRAPCVDAVAVYATKVENGRIFLRLEPPKGAA